MPGSCPRVSYVHCTSASGASLFTHHFRKNCQFQVPVTLKSFAKLNYSKSSMSWIFFPLLLASLIPENNFVAHRKNVTSMFVVIFYAAVIDALPHLYNNGMLRKSRCLKHPKKFSNRLALILLSPFWSAGSVWLSALKESPDRFWMPEMKRSHRGSKIEGGNKIQGMKFGQAWTANFKHFGWGDLFWKSSRV
jgi:hypothetical protein